jgi:hypothetical protein
MKVQRIASVGEYLVGMLRCENDECGAVFPRAYDIHSHVAAYVCVQCGQSSAYPRTGDQRPLTEPQWDYEPQIRLAEAESVHVWRRAMN